MKKQEYKHFKFFYNSRSRTIRALNDIYVTRHLSYAAMNRFVKHLQTIEASNIAFRVPSIVQDKIVVTRDKAKILGLVVHAQNRGLYAQALITAVAITESYLLKTTRTILLWYPLKLKAGASESRESTQISLETVLKSPSIESLISMLVEKRLMGIFYQSPEKYFRKIETLLSVKVDEKLKRSYAEIKATRDVLVHNDGIVNQMYLDKSQKEARARTGELVPLDRVYMESAIRCMKAIVQSMYNQILSKYGNAASTKIS